MYVLTYLAINLFLILIRIKSDMHLILRVIEARKRDIVWLWRRYVRH